MQHTDIEFEGERLGTVGFGTKKWKFQFHQSFTCNETPKAKSPILVKTHKLYLSAPK